MYKKVITHERDVDCVSWSAISQAVSEQGELIQELALELSGTSLRLGEKAPAVGGTDKLPQDFEHSHNFVDQEQV